jgi:hypothetical protein
MPKKTSSSKTDKPKMSLTCAFEVSKEIPRPVIVATPTIAKTVKIPHIMTSEEYKEDAIVMDNVYLKIGEPLTEEQQPVIVQDIENPYDALVADQIPSFSESGLFLDEDAEDRLPPEMADSPVAENGNKAQAQAQTSIVPTSSSLSSNLTSVSSLFPMPTLAEEQAVNTSTKKKGQRKKPTTKNCKELKRVQHNLTIGAMLEALVKWRACLKQDGWTPEEAAKFVGMKKKTLDYFCGITKIGIMYGFEFFKNRKEKTGVLGSWAKGKHLKKEEATEEITEENISR